MAKVCLKCGYERKPQEMAPETECPKCGIIYAKVEYAIKKAQQAETPDPPSGVQNDTQK